MPTEKQLAANRANAARSTGPRTPAGKTRSAQNARKHGFAGSDFAIVKIEDRDAVALNRALFNLEDEQPFVPLHEELQVDAEDIKIQNRHYCLAQGFRRMNVENSATWSLFLRYQAQAERQYRRAVEELERLTKLRKDLPNEPIFEPEPEETRNISASENEPISNPPDWQRIFPRGRQQTATRPRPCGINKDYGFRV